MRVRALKQCAPGNGIFNPGSVFDLPDGQAASLIAAGVVEDAEPPVDRAMEDAAENKMQPKRGRRAAAAE